MRHDVFISYSREDEAWARKLEAELTTRGLEVYRDQTRLQAGDEWQPALRDAIADSRSLALIWSDAHAAASKWVAKENEAFRQMMHLDAREGRTSVRRLIQICLAGRNPDYAEFQTILDLDKENAYAKGADAVNPNVWNRVVEKVVDAVSVDEKSPFVHHVVLCSTRSRLQKLADDSRAVTFSAPFRELIAGLKFVSRDELLSRYTEDRTEWTPFGGEKTILTLLNEIRAELLKRGVTKFLWKPVGDGFWTGTRQHVVGIRDQLKTEPCVIVLDAVSLYDSDVRDRYQLLLDCLDNPKAAVMVLPPYYPSQRPYIRSLLECAADRLFEPFYYPDKARAPIAANCSVMAEDPYEMSRLIAAAVKVSFKDPKYRALRYR